ncbi:Non-classical phosphatidylinositol transfer protein (PITP) [Yamadazyma tenuis]|uniref:Phosphatidylinositol transfer protein SFH5 n=1 Tax=Candida tenuis (strain ATCC 10573 / BCRC 21748 / CBS 615 / JCM 9827 / NBRC 10315 / NRRL Y-1498 / VKM Y-70) TaxID=590646 RepID=G3B7E4_CANTC|nr:phosphatidylinositol transfer protein SFH5 [Yamadazyma tenuis ATCC 10573]EGV62254.1 phosphatidylinositol transfer protein SFH5 [Yamadazyma tenuis ATCC 10573]WEJ93512.1 Non-classical phosphatidylinositol transfer protein (PITP) [Yamadazyma tenuis]
MSTVQSTSPIPDPTTENVPDPSTVKSTKNTVSSEVNEKAEPSASLVQAVKITKDQEAKLQTLIQSIPKILDQLDDKEYDEIFGYRINVAGEEYVNETIRNEILLKFLIANEYDVSITITKLVKTLNWRHTFKPLSAAYNEKFDAQLNKLGVVTYLPREKLDNFKVATWNLYGNVKDPKALFEHFGGSDSKLPGSTFLRWRVGLMEDSLSFVDFTDAANHKIAQIHDYNNVSMFRMDKKMKETTKEIIHIFGDNYPELLSTKFFLNVPSIMSWVFGFFTTIGVISKQTLQKFRPLNHGNLTEWFTEPLPSAYNGGNSSKIGSIFDLDVAKQAQIPTYAKVILEKINKENIEDLTNDVE